MVWTWHLPAHHFSITKGPTAVTNLTAAATSSQSIRVSWDLPLYPNGPILFYKLFYRASNTPQQPPNIRSDGYLEILVTDTEFEVTSLITYTNYTIHVLAIGQGNLFGGIDTEILQQTNSIIRSITFTGTEESSFNTINVHLPPPFQVQTGIVV